MGWIDPNYVRMVVIPNPKSEVMQRCFHEDQMSIIIMGTILIILVVFKLLNLN